MRPPEQCKYLNILIFFALFLFIIVECSIATLLIGQEGGLAVGNSFEFLDHTILHGG